MPSSKLQNIYSLKWLWGDADESIKNKILEHVMSAIWNAAANVPDPRGLRVPGSEGALSGWGGLRRVSEGSKVPGFLERLLDARVWFLDRTVWVNGSKPPRAVQKGFQRLVQCLQSNLSCGESLEAVAGLAS